MADDLEDPTPRTDAEASIGGDASARLSTAARALVLGNALASPIALLGIAPEIAALGFSVLPPVWGGWKGRIEAVEESDRILRGLQILDQVEERERARFVAVAGAPTRESRVSLWTRVAEEQSSPAAAIAWLRALMTDEEPVAAAAAASALASWRRRSEFEVPSPLEAAVDLVPRYETSGDPDAVAIALAASGQSVERTERTLLPRKATEPIGTIVHGTFAYPETWWEPAGDFHTFAKESLCANLYSGGRPFDWSGAYKGKHREKAASRFAKWVGDASPDGLCCAFAHSYGGSIALHATSFGLKINRLGLPRVWLTLGVDGSYAASAAW